MATFHGRSVFYVGTSNQFYLLKIPSEWNINLQLPWFVMSNLQSFKGTEEMQEAALPKPNQLNFMWQIGCVFPCHQQVHHSEAV